MAEKNTATKASSPQFVPAQCSNQIELRKTARVVEKSGENSNASAATPATSKHYQYRTVGESLSEFLPPSLRG